MNMASSPASPCFGSFYQPCVDRLKAEVSTFKPDTYQGVWPTAQRIALAKSTLDLYQNEPLTLTKKHRSELMYLKGGYSFEHVSEGLKGTLGNLTLEVVEIAYFREKPSRCIVVYPTSNQNLEGALVINMEFSEKDGKPVSYFTPAMNLVTGSDRTRLTVPHCKESEQLYKTLASILDKVEKAIDDTGNTKYQKYMK